jgi:hypothetical protein
MGALSKMMHVILVWLLSDDVAVFSCTLDDDASHGRLQVRTPHALARRLKQSQFNT